MLLWNPPVNEVVVATQLSSPLAGLRNEHIGLLWHSWKDEFPLVEQHVPIGTGSEMQVNEMVPLPRYWFVSEDDTQLIQLQRDILIFNWRRREGQEYPRYSSIKQAFNKYFDRLEKFVITELGVSALGIDTCELVYGNVVQAGEYWKGPQDTPKVMPAFSSALFPNVNSVLVCEFAYQREDNMKLTVGVRNKIETVPPELFFNIKASAGLDMVTKAEADAWFERAHDAVIECFLNLTSKDVRDRYWCLGDSP